MDLKPGNILVTPTCVPVISDLGFAKNLRVNNKYTLIGGTEGYIHPEARRFVTEAKTDPNRLRGESPRLALRREWDLFSLGKTFLKLLTVLDMYNPRVLSPYQKRYLRLLSCRLLDGQNNDDELAVGLSRLVFHEIKYRDATAARMDLEKLSGSYNLEARIPELNLHLQDTIQVSTLGPTPFTDRVKKTIEHPLLARLGEVSQLGLLNLVYPTATHSRLEHSIGTFSVLCRYLVALYNDALNPLFKQIMNEEDLRAVLVAGLLHDVGQYPLAHDVEEADPFMLRHEEIGKTLVMDEKSGLRPLVEKEWHIPLKRVVDILEANSVSLQGDLKARILHSLIDGPIDADKLDYLIRDSRRLGLTYGAIIDLERLLRCLTIVFRRQNGGTFAALGIHEKGKVTAEAIAFARYAMFGQVYWHHAYRAFKIMLHRLVWEALRRSQPTECRQHFRSFVTAEPLTTWYAARRSVVQRPNQEDMFPMPSHFLPERDTLIINPADLGVLRWFSDRAGTTGTEIYRLIARRQLFKRLLVLSRDRMTDRSLWGRLSDFSRSYKRNFNKKLALQEALQRRIVTVVGDALTPRAQSAVITEDNRNRFLSQAQKQVVILVDIPPESSVRGAALEFLVEEDRRRYKIDEVQIESLEESVVWLELQKNSREAIGKVRVFCHPDHREFLSAYLLRSEIEGALDGALREVDSA